MFRVPGGRPIVCDVTGVGTLAIAAWRKLAPMRGKAIDRALFISRDYRSALAIANVYNRLKRL
jgi:hypothetical protein